MKTRNLLLVEDDANLAYLLKENLEANGYNVSWSKDGEAGLKSFVENKATLCLLDVMMPKKDGLTLAKEIRKRDTNVPIIFLTAKSQTQNRIDGFLAGGDDYITKPFSVKELLLRINAVLRRVQPTAHAKPSLKHAFGNCVFDFDTRALSVNGNAVVLNSKEAGVLKLLCENIGTFINRRVILNTVWENDDFLTGKSLDVYLTRLRKVLKQDASLQIENLYGTGYRLVVSNTAAS